MLLWIRQTTAHTCHPNLSRNHLQSHRDAVNDVYHCDGVALEHFPFLCSEPQASACAISRSR